MSVNPQAGYLRQSLISRKLAQSFDTAVRADILPSHNWEIWNSRPSPPK